MYLYPELGYAFEGNTVRINQSSYDWNPNEQLMKYQVSKSHSARITGGESVYFVYTRFLPSPCGVRYRHKHQSLSAHIQRAPGSLFPHWLMKIVPASVVYISHLWLVRDDCTMYDSYLSFVADGWWPYVQRCAMDSEWVIDVRSPPPANTFSSIFQWAKEYIDALRITGAQLCIWASFICHKWKMWIIHSAIISD